MSLGKKVFSSAVLLFVRKIWGNVINLIVMAFLARILSKEDFGLLAISSVLLSIINSLATSGISEYIISYKGEFEKEVINATFWLNLLLTFGVVLVCVTAGPFWAEFYENEKIFNLILLLLVSFVFHMTSTIPRSLLRKDLDYKTIVLYSTVSMTSISIGKLVAAFLGMGVYSLALPQAIVSPLLMIAFFLKADWKPMLKLGIIYFKDIFRFSGNVVGARVLTRIVNEGDNLIVGKFVGLEGLGVYTLAFNLANLVTTNVVFIANDIFLPLYSKVKDDAERLRDIYKRMINVLASISFPAITTLVIVAEPIVSLIYGEKWFEAIVPFQILCIFAIGRSLSSPSSAIFSAMGRPDISFKFAIFLAPVFLIAVFVGSQYSVIGVAIATTIVRVSGSIISLSLSLKLIRLTLADLFEIISRNFIVSVLFVLIFFSFFKNVFNEQNNFLVLLVVPVIVYAQYILQRFLFRRNFIMFLNEIKHLIGKKMSFRILDKFLFIH